MRSFPGYTFHLYVPGTAEWRARLGSQANFTVQLHDSPDYLPRLASARAAIATAGHALLSELTFLRVPLMAIPYRTFEQEYNAKMIEDAECGMSVEAITLGSVSTFLERLPNCEATYRNRPGIFVDCDGTQAALSIIEQLL
jgi:UDP:flavonoid glycosyltransferase YjiC (YdhE family)